MANQQMQQWLNGRNIIITGGTTGIGRETALQLVKLGANVLIAGLDEQHLQETLNDAEGVGNNGKLNGVIADVATDEGIAKVFSEADALFGSRLDVLINNAAIAYASIMEGNYPDWKRAVDTNLLAYMACAHMAIDRMRSAKDGHLVFIGSMSAEVREAQSSVYVATKAGVQGFAASLRKEVNESGIRVTLIEPGAVDTDMQPQSTDEKHQEVEAEKMLIAADIAAAVIYALNQDKRCDVVEIKLRPRLQII